MLNLLVHVVTTGLYNARVLRMTNEFHHKTKTVKLKTF